MGGSSPIANLSKLINYNFPWNQQKTRISWQSLIISTNTKCVLTDNQHTVDTLLFKLENYFLYYVSLKAKCFQVFSTKSVISDRSILNKRQHEKTKTNKKRSRLQNKYLVETFTFYFINYNTLHFPFKSAHFSLVHVFASQTLN